MGQKTLIIYESTHHGNTRKLVDAIAEAFPVDTAEISEAVKMDLNAYDRIGLASGIAFAKFYPDMEAFANERLPEGKKVFFLYTCGKDTGRYASHIRKTVEGKGCQVLGVYGCPGFDTYGSFRLVGGISKGHPTEKEIQEAVDFYGALGE